MTMSREERPKEPWVFVTELKKDFTVKPVPMTATKIDDDIKVLVVVHPRNITDATQYAIDQFLMRGGKLLAFLDPHAYFDESHDMQNQSFQVVGELAYGQSSLDKLAQRLGIEHGHQQSGGGHVLRQPQSKNRRHDADHADRHARGH